MNYPYLITGRSAMVRIGQRLYQVDINHPRWDAIGVLLRSPEHDVQALRRNMDPSLTVTKAGGGAITLDRGQVRFKGKRVPDVLSAKLTAVLDDHGDLLPWIAFVDKLMHNPLVSAREELLLFLQAAKLPITPDGDLLAYKKVRQNYTAVHDGTTPYEIGQITEMARKSVDTDRDQLCSSGLHFASRGYLRHFSGARTIVVKINPADVVAIPSDYENAKGRTWRMETVGELHQLGTELIDGVAYAQPDPQATAAPGMEANEVVATAIRNPSIVTARHGVLTRAKLVRLRKEHGSWSGVSTALDVGTGTVAAWVAKLGLVKNPRGAV